MPSYRANGDAIRAVREALGLNLTRAADKAKITPKTLRHMETRDDRFSDTTFRKVGEALEMAFADMLRPEAKLEPVRGLRAYDLNEEELFGGRDNLIVEGVRLLRERKVLAVSGASGSGKSSLCRAGIIPAFLEGEDGYAVVDMRPGTQAVDALADALAAAFGMDAGALGDLRKLLRRDGAALADVLTVEMRRAGLDGALIHVDQAEELATRAQDGADFLALLNAVIERHGIAVSVLLSARDEGVGRLAMLHSGFARRIPTTLMVARMDDAALREALERPLDVTRTAYDSALIERIVHDARGNDGYLPHAQFVLESLWRDEEVPAGKRLTLDRYVIAGGMTGVIARKADAACRALDAEERAVARAALPRLVASGPGLGRDVAARTPLADFTPEARAVLEKLAGPETRLLSVDSGGTVGFAHEEVIRSWNDLQSWLAEREADAALLESLERRVAEWRLHGEQNQDLFPPGRRLTALRALVARTPDAALPADATRYLTASSRLRRRFDRRAISASLTIVAGVAGGLSLYGKWESDRLQRAEDEINALVAERGPGGALERRMLFPDPNDPDRLATDQDFGAFRVRPFGEEGDTLRWQTYFNACPDPVEMDFTGLIVPHPRLATGDGRCPLPTVTRSRFAFAILTALEVGEGQQLVHSDFTGTFLLNADFGNADLRGTHFSCAIIDEADFTKARNLHPAALSEAFCLNEGRGMPKTSFPVPGCDWKQESDAEKAMTMKQQAFEDYYSCARRERAYMLSEDALRAMEAGDTKTATRLLDRARGVDPDNAVVELRRAHLFHLTGRSDDAVALYRKVVAFGKADRLGSIRRIACIDLKGLKLSQNLHWLAGEGGCD